MTETDGAPQSLARIRALRLQFNPDMLSIARDIRMMTQTALSKETGLSQSKISRFQNGKAEPTDDDVLRLSEVLEFPVAFFFQVGKRYDKLYY